MNYWVERWLRTNDYSHMEKRFKWRFKIAYRKSPVNQNSDSHVFGDFRQNVPSTLFECIKLTNWTKDFRDIFIG